MIDEKSALIYSQMPEHKMLVRKTINFIKWSLSNVDNPYLACSFGKDSAVMLHLVYEQCNNIPVRFVRWKFETDLMNNYNEVIKQWLDKYDINLHEIELSRNTLDEVVADRYVTEGYDSYFIGFRKNESAARRITISTMGKFAKMKSGIIRISPMADWTVNDIAAYIIENKIPTLKSYGIDGFDARTSSRVPRADYGIRTASLTQLKNRDIKSYNELIAKFPDARYFT